MKAFADNLAVVHDDAAHRWIWAGQAYPFARKLQGALHEANVVSVHDSVEERIGVGFGVERHKIIDLFAGTNKPDRQAEFARYSHDNAAFGRAIELGENDPRDANRRSEFTRLRQAVLPSGRVKDEQHVMRRTGNHFGGAALHFF